MRLTSELLSRLNTPCYVLEEERLLANAKILAGVQTRTGCKILLAQKAFSNYAVYPLLAPYLAGTEASGLYEARLGWEEMPGKECHVFCAAYRAQEFSSLLQYADHIVFNSISQLEQFGARAKAAGKEVGLRINPMCSTQTHAIYDPCAPGSRLGVTKEQWDAWMTPTLFSLLDGLHFHTLCEQNSDALKVTLAAVEEQFGAALSQMRWLNFGGGHHITRPDYDLSCLEQCIVHMRDTYGLQIYLEPGEAVALRAGYLVTQVLDIVQNGISIAILDTSAACHMPDVLEMPYTPPLDGAVPLSDMMENGDTDTCYSQQSTLEKERTNGGISSAQQPVKETDTQTCQKEQTSGYVYRLGGPTCLSGDIIGDYCLKHPLHRGDKLIFEDMAIYTTVKNNTFNGMPLPDICLLRCDGTIETLRSFGYEDFKGRL